MSQSSINFAPYQHGNYVPPPPLKLNGGLYTGEPFAKDAPWGNVPVVADVDYMIQHNLRSANPPVQALFQYPGGVRPGNNYQAQTGLIKPDGYDFICTPCVEPSECKKVLNQFVTKCVKPR